MSAVRAGARTGAERGQTDAERDTGGEPEGEMHTLKAITFVFTWYESVLQKVGLLSSGHERCLRGLGRG